MAKPILIQEHVADDPWKVLVAVALLNKTAGRHAVPTFFDLTARWPTAPALAQASPDALERLITHLGLGKSRTKRLIALSQAYVSDPPQPGALRPSRCYVQARMLSSETGLLEKVRQRYPPTCASHLPGSGPYALDSYRIFCGPPDEWKRVMPHDKELVKYIKWKWAVSELRSWDKLDGPGESVGISYLRELTDELQT
ncbi:uncharacterized protein LAESUDRAFT_724821 [Laetiporus sulphureus 93-53]|uniref:HhH-GPD domain-containing protein n=1 Tax=Laetiporus sulphureus 93-53 TaxID=1314785 RepID=A0A165EMG5_9APHY|nr:uncharacterized protein LAESUDRAFT_724821 [Laetiporus sulphureus 93-53]KZT07369.1 hypothetical protein LAESUDRAFT_724821 [Laetiporus sulphureus 93-53]